MTKPPQVVHGDCLEIMQMLPNDSVDSIVTDPPYGLGFMGKAWDALPPGLEWAEECLRVLKPGGHLLAFGGTRTWHRLAVAVEDAGFEIRDSIAWMYGSGFPKSHDVSKGIDKVRDWSLVEKLSAEIKRARAESGLSLKDIGRVMQEATGGQYGTWYYRGGHMFFETGRSLPSRPEWERLRGVLPIRDEFSDVYAEAERKVIQHRTMTQGGGTSLQIRMGERREVSADITAPATDAAKQWQGWGTALKPAFEPVVVARKPLIGTVAANVLAHGTGALNIDATRIGTTKDVPASASTSGGKGIYSHMDALTERGGMDPNVGRWPANVVLDEHAAEILDQQSGVTVSKAHNRGKPGGSFRLDGCSSVAELRNLALKGERTPTGRDAATSLARYEEQEETITGPSDSGGASRFFYVAKAPKKERPVVDGVAHATVKPLALMRWLVRLVTPEGGTVLEPFAGSGTTVEACILEGFHCIAIEREEEYLPLIQARIDRQEAA